MRQPRILDRLAALESLRVIEAGDVKRERGAQTAAFGRLMASLDSACPSPVGRTAGASYACEPFLPGIADRWLAGASTDDDRRILSAMSEDDLKIYGVTGPAFVATMAHIFGLS